MSLVAELKRRNVIRMAGLYFVGAWLIVQVSSTVLPMFDAPAWLPRTIVLLLAIGFVPALVFAWAFEMTPHGVRRESEVDRTASITPNTGRRMDRMMLAGLALIIVLMGVERVWFARRPAAPAVPASVAEAPARLAPVSNPSATPVAANAIAVMAFDDLSPAHDQA